MAVELGRMPASYDDWKTTDPDEYDGEEKTLCYGCGKPIEPGDRYMDAFEDGEYLFCEDCVDRRLKEWR